MNHQDLVKEITEELYKDKNVIALMLYGSVSRNEESINSDVDLLAIINENYCQKRHVIHKGITVEYLEMHVDYLQNFINQNEIPIIFTLVEGTVLFDKISLFDTYINKAKRIIEKGSILNEKWNNERYVTKRRSDLTEIYNDLLDTEEEIVFNYLVTLLITSAIPLLNESRNLWPKTRKRTIQYLKAQCNDGYNYIEALLKSNYSVQDKRIAAKKLIEYIFIQHGGVLEGSAIIFKF